ncbi:MAG: SU10 major capsid protein [Pikeienuella sp.]
MAQPTNTFDSYDYSNSIREDLSNIITNVDPDETPLYSKSAKGKASSTNTEWLTDALRASANNAHIEGDDTTAEARVAQTRVGNYTQIFKNAVVIPDTDDGLDNAGKGRAMAYEVMKVAKEQKLDIERALFLNNAKVAGNSTTARELGGLPTWLTSNISEGAGATSATGAGGTARTGGTARALTQTIFDGVMQDVWDNGGKPDTVYLPSSQMSVVLGFTGSNNQRATIDASKTKVVNVTDVYMTPWGTVEFKMDREMGSDQVFIVQSDMVEIPTLRGMTNKALAKTGDNEKRQVVCELTLKVRNEKALGGIYDLS